MMKTSSAERGGESSVVGLIDGDEARMRTGGNSDADPDQASMPNNALGSSATPTPAHLPGSLVNKSVAMGQSHTVAAETPQKSTLSVPNNFAGPSTFLSSQASHATLSPRLERNLGRKRSSSILSTTSSTYTAPSSPSVLGLKSAKLIENIRAISYTLETTSPALALEPATPANFQYDPEFIKQLTEGCEDLVAKEDFVGTPRKAKGPLSTAGPSGGVTPQERPLKPSNNVKDCQAIAEGSANAVIEDVPSWPADHTVQGVEDDTSKMNLKVEAVADERPRSITQAAPMNDNISTSPLAADVVGTATENVKQNEAKTAELVKDEISRPDDLVAIPADSRDVHSLAASADSASSPAPCTGCGRPEHAEHQAQVAETAVTVPTPSTAPGGVGTVATATPPAATSDVVWIPSSTATTTAGSVTQQATAGTSRPPIHSHRPSFLSTMKTIEQKWKVIFNRLNAKNLDQTSRWIMDSINRDIDDRRSGHVRFIVQLIFEKVIDEKDTSKICALLAQKIWREISPYVKDVKDVAPGGKPYCGSSLFQRYMLGRCLWECNKEFKRNFASPRAFAPATATISAVTPSDTGRITSVDDDTSKSGTKGKEVDIPYELSQMAANLQRRIGLLTFVGELYNVEIVMTALLDGCIINLLSDKPDNVDEANLEALCRMLPIVGVKLEAQFEMTRQMQHHMQQMKRIVQSGILSSRTKSLMKVGTSS